MVLEGRRVLFISYNGMLDPLGQSQVIPYLRELARAGVRFTLLSFERSAAFGTEGRDRCADLKRQLAAAGIEWHWLRYHQRPSLPATMYDVANGVRLDLTNQATFSIAAGVTLRGGRTAKTPGPLLYTRKPSSLFTPNR